MKKLKILIILIGVVFSSVGGQVPTKPDADITADKTVTVPPTEKPPVGPPELTAADVETFLGGMVPVLLEQADIAGATVSVVRNGEVVFAEGYGYADVKNKKPVVADKTLFRPGSVSKLFTWTAVMQMAEQGKLDLDADVNKYLDFKLPETYDKPITLKNLLTHTAGFEEQIKDIFGGEKSPDLGTFLKTHIPRRIYPPGTVPAYSNYGTALAGYIVERVSGQKFNQYVEQNIFKPLGMNDSSFAQPLPENLAPQMSNGYKQASGEAQPFEVVGPYPAGSLSSTATDMAKFMLAHLQEGSSGDGRILKPETVRQMHTRLFALDEKANAMAYGFYEENSHGKRIIGHGGDTVAFHSDLHLIPEAGVGFFISYNSAGNGKNSPREVIWNAFLDRYFPAEPANDAQALKTAAEDAAAVSGTYMTSRRPEGSFLRTMALLGEVSVYANEDGTISVEGLNDPNDRPKRWREVAPMRFQDVGGYDSLIFKPDADGRMQLVLPYPFMIFQRVGFLDNGKILLPVVGISLLIMLLTLILWFVGWLVRRHYGRKLELTPWEWKLRLAVRIVFALDLIFVAALVGLLVYMLSNFAFISDYGNMWVRIVQVVGVIAVLGTLVVFYNAVYAWLSKDYRIWGKLQATLFAAACLGFLWLVYAGNFLSFTSHF
jgi:CubicO group peptidase (beta-lactamase class C family)